MFPHTMATHRRPPPYTVRHIDFDQPGTSSVVHDLLLSYLHDFARFCAGSNRESHHACDELVERAVTDIAHHFTFPLHDALKIATVDMSYVLRVS
jgi:hypothetical protein